MVDTSGKCPTCSRVVKVRSDGSVHRHKAGAEWCAGGKVSRSAGADVIDITGRKKPGGPKRAGKMTKAEQSAENAKRPPSKAIDRAGNGVCAAKLKERGEYTDATCMLAKGQGTDHLGFGRCQKHGGRSPNGRKHAALERARHEYARAKRDGFFGRRVAVDPEQALLEEMQRTAGAVRWLEAALREWGRVEALTEEMRELDPAADPDTVADRVDRFLAKLDDRTAEAGAVTYVTSKDERTGLPTLVAVHSTERAVGFTDTEYRAWLKVYMEERRHLAAVAKACIDADIAERRQAVLEARADMIRSLVMRAFTIAGVEMDENRQLAVIAEATRMVAKELPA